jgi:hypothetical protein
MYAKNLERILALLCEKSDASHSTGAEYDERFKSLRGYGRLPRGRERREEALSEKQITAAVFGLVATRPGWAGHVAIILEGLSPVGGTGGSFFAAETLSDAVAQLLSNETARKSFIRLTVTVAETGVNSNGGAELVYERDGERRRAYFVPAMAMSLLQPGREVRFDPDHDRLNAPAMREMSFSHRFFDRLALECERAKRLPAPPEGDGSEYDAEEAEQERRKKLGVCNGSNFLNVGVENQVTWPKEEKLISFDRYQIVLLPMTKDNMPSIHVDLTTNHLDNRGARTLINRFLSLMSWCDDNFAIASYGWSGSPIPQPVSKRNLGFTTAHDYIFDRKIPATEKAQRALALYREARNAEESGFIGQAVLNYYRIIEIKNPIRGDVKNWFRDNFEVLRADAAHSEIVKRFLDHCGLKKPHEYIHESCRVAVSHANKDSKSDPDDAHEVIRLHSAADVMQLLARRFIEKEFAISKVMYSGE